MGACGGGAFVDRWWVTGERDAGYTDRWGAYERIGVGRLVVAVAASAAIWVSGTARAESPRATIEGQLDRDLREAIDRAVGETDKPIANRFEARRRANDAGEDAIAVLRCAAVRLRAERPLERERLFVAEENSGEGPRLGEPVVAPERAIDGRLRRDGRGEEREREELAAIFDPVERDCTDTRAAELRGELHEREAALVEARLAPVERRRPTGRTGCGHGASTRATTRSPKSEGSGA